MKLRLAVCALAIVVSGIPTLFPQQAAAADDDLFQQMDIGFFSVGGRATYYDPQEGQSRWFGGGQVRVNPFRYLSFEGSADYRRRGYGRVAHPHLSRASLRVDLPPRSYPIGSLSARRRRVVLHHGQRTGQFR